MRSLFLTLMLGVTFSAPAFAQINTGKILIKLGKSSKTDAEASAQLDSLPAAKELGLKLERRSVFGWLLVDVGTGDGDTERIVDRLRREKGVAAADTIVRQHAFRFPNDELTGELWGFAAIGADLAWDTTVGLPTQRIGMVDTGINRDHIDLIAKDRRGFDFISFSDLSNDGDGRDSDYSDADPEAGFHGSHVAGTMLASADDGIGVPGLNWNAQLVTGRALGSLGGDSVDIVEAAAWMAGADVPGVPSIGADRVSVINVSLGSDNPCSPFQEDVYGQIIAAGVAVVAAAGNSGNAEPTGAPANCPGVIAVAAAGPTFELTSYSNFDERIDVVAPGGDGFGDETDSELSILSVDGGSDFSYKSIDGTSMATPHVAGVVSLMQAVNPRLSPRQIRDILLGSPFTCGGCNNESFLDAEDAIAQAQQTDGELDDAPPPPPNGGGASDDCPANSSPVSGESGCFCDPGFVLNATQSACIDGGNETGGECPPNSSPSGDSCSCDDGFVVNAAETGCVAKDSEPVKDKDDDSDDDNDDDDDDDDDDDASEFSGCSSTGASTTLTGALGLVALGIRRRRLAE